MAEFRQAVPAIMSLNDVGTWVVESRSVDRMLATRYIHRHAQDDDDQRLLVDALDLHGVKPWG